MTLQVQSKMVRSGKCSLAMLTFEWFHASVFAHVSSEFIRAGKLPTASLPVTLVRFLSGVCSLVCLEVRALGVDLVAPGVRTAVNTLVPLWRLSVIVDSVHEIVR